LSIVTLGIYTAWAKVRRLRYFYGNTWLDGHNFEYHAKPIQILIGRIIVVVVLVIFNVLAEVAPFIALALLIPYFLAFPWLINKAIAFNARMTSYRNVRFSFDGSYGRAFYVFVLMPLLPVIFIAVLSAALFYSGVITDFITSLNTIIGLGVLYLVLQILFIPYISKLSSAYIGSGTSFGNAKFTTDPSFGAMFGNFLTTIVPIVVILAIMGFGIFQSIDTSVQSDNPLAAVGVILFYILFIAAYLAYSAGVRNISFNATELQGGHSLDSNVPRFGYAWVILTNLIVTVLSIGLMSAWAAVRTWRYLTNHTSMNVSGDLESFISQQNPEGNVAAAEYLDIEGIDLGL
ncbi:MAG: YjgN family protein, partial [Pseudomonadota bacterium]